MNHLKITNIDDLLTNAATPRLIEAQIIDYIMSLHHDGVVYSTIKAITNPIFTFYQLNDVLLNRKKVYRYLGEFRRVVKEQAKKQWLNEEERLAGYYYSLVINDSQLIFTSLIVPIDL